MYAKFFGLSQAPFAIAPDPRYLYMSERHREALAHLLYGVRAGGGFVLLTGEIGAGKTTVCRCFLEQVPPQCNVAYIFNPRLSVAELLQTICEEFHVTLPAIPAAEAGSTKRWIDALNAHLLRAHAAGQSNVLIIDEAQNLAPELLEQLRLLTNLETTERKLLQIILIGQPELREMLARPELEQLAQRVIARYHLGPLDAGQTARYVLHRLGVAGSTGASPFDGAAMRRIHQLSGGVPRRINLLCDRALLGAYATGRQQIGAEVIDRAAAEVFDRHPPARRDPAGAASWRRMAPWAGGAVAGGLAASAALWAGWRSPAPPAAPPQAVAATTPRPDSTPTSPSTSEAAAAQVRAGSPPGATPPPAPPPVLAPAELRAAFEGSLRGEDGAWRELAAAWGVALPPGTDPCTASARVQLPCFKGAGSLTEIRQLDRPGVVALHDDQQRLFHVLLVAIDDERAVLQRGGRTLVVPLASLGAAWRGGFGTFWRAPPGYSGLTGLQSAPGPASQWLRARLDRAAPVAGAPVDPSPAALAARIAAFQVTQGLPPDGMAGPKTLMRLNRVTGVDEPRLAPTAAVIGPAPAPSTLRTPAPAASTPATPATPATPPLSAAATRAG